MRSRATSPLPWLGGLIVLYLLAPIVAFLGRLAGGVSPSPGFGSALLTSLLTATIATAVIGVLGTPLAYLLARGKTVLTRVLGVVVALPLALPPLVSGLLLLYVVGPYTLAGRIFGGQLTETRAGIVLAQTFVAAPFLIIVARSAFATVDPALEDVAASLGHGRLSRFARVAVPAALPGLAAGLLLAWLRAFAEFGATIILAYHPYSLPVFTYVQFDATGLPATMLPIAAALAAAFVVLALASLAPPRRRRGQSAPASVVAVGPAAGPPALALEFELAKRLGTFSLEVSHHARSHRLALLGPSGAGKTLTLQLLAGLSSPDRAGHVVAGTRKLHALPAERRQVGYVPQEPALLPRRTVWRQVTFGVRARPALAAWWLQRLGLSGLENRYPDELSSGQQRRVSIARALATEPRLLLLDEPFTGLDAPVRDRLRRALRRLQIEANLSTVIVTHDPEEAALLADEVIILSDGHILQSGTRESVFHTPASPEIARLLGIANANRGVVLGPGLLASSGAVMRAPTGEMSEGAQVIWSVRPERVSPDPRGHYEARLLDEVDLGAVRELTISLDGALELLIRTDLRAQLRIGQQLTVEVPAEDINVWPAVADPIVAGSRATS
ncbi:MAG TPA: ATP-binding cassette domain-containing protein [Solirubrobacteraceae bacterium]|nr:ATP-binding cassette domain-containing protein [Solirubrobacteraceae bacterium]